MEGGSLTSRVVQLTMAAEAGRGCRGFARLGSWVTGPWLAQVPGKCLVHHVLPRAEVGRATKSLQTLRALAMAEGRPGFLLSSKMYHVLVTG